MRFFLHDFFFRKGANIGKSGKFAIIDTSCVSRDFEGRSSRDGVMNEKVSNKELGLFEVA